MSDQNDWLRQLSQMQQQYLQGWRDLAGPAAKPASGVFGAMPWPDGLAGWQQGMSGFAGGHPFAMPTPFAAAGVPDGNQIVERMLAYGKQYLGLLQSLMVGRGFQDDAQRFDPRAWINELRELQQRYGSSLSAGLAPVAPPPWFGGIDAAQVEQLVKSFTVPTLGALRPELDSWLSLPAFGPNREHQERGQALLRAWLDYQVAQQRYGELMLQSAARTLDALEARLGERDQPGRRIETVRALYDLWIDAAEDAYAQIAISPEYGEVYGELANAQMRVRAGINAEIERLGGQFGMPTRTEVDSLARQLHQLKREFRARPARAAAEAAKPADPQAVVRPPPAKEQPGSTASAAATGASGSGKTKKSARRSPSAASRKRAAEAPVRSTHTDAAVGTSKAKAKARKRRKDEVPVLRSTARKTARGD